MHLRYSFALLRLAWIGTYGLRVSIWSRANNVRTCRIASMVMIERSSAKLRMFDNLIIHELANELAKEYHCRV